MELAIKDNLINQMAQQAADRLMCGQDLYYASLLLNHADIREEVERIIQEPQYSWAIADIRNNMAKIEGEG